MDVEGNGQTPPGIIEIAIPPVAGTSVGPEDIRSWLIRPENPITPSVTRKVHGISHSDVEDRPEWEAGAPQVVRIMFVRILLAHNANVGLTETYW